MLFAGAYTSRCSVAFTSRNISFNLVLIDSTVALGGLVVAVLAIGPKVRGFKRGRGLRILRAIKIRSTTSVRGDVKPVRI
jgi:hypothetical protein